ncbi:efflux transporter outer membrane subunit [Marinifilum sp. D737]|jgi:NodT family efflux transporter outer membrane factor (OMF) lipoprotein|uniref:efflux transporter outer membrane subunit n=1 Tax=Marinifilum sp. D737 TaxID=2969628 RepID=UPI0022741BD0|nr:TolC family protein [Marinifilum sp. D737]MCY1634126.1 TolC family protein [Marinifilum sp. D737]
MRTKKIIYGVVFLAFATTSLQSCFVAKKYQQPDIEIQDQYRNVSTTDSATLANMPWEELFTDKQLKKLINEVLDSNLDLQMAVERVNAAEAYYKQGKMGYLPSLNLSANGGNYELSDNSQSGVAAGGNGPNYENYQLNGTISWEADIWGKIRSNKRAAQASFLQSEASKRAVESSLIANTASAYYQLLALDAQVEVAERTVTTRKESLETMKSLKDAGQVTEAAVKQTEAQLYSTQILLLDLKQNVSLLENTISLLLGRNPNMIERGKLTNQDIKIELNTGFPVQLLRNRPDVMLAEYGLMNAFELTNVARSNFYPTISVSATAGLESMNFDDWFDSGAIFSNIVGNLTQPLFNKRRVRTQHEVAKAQQAEARHNFKKSVLTASKEVSDALYSYESEQNKYEIRKQELQALTEAVSYSEELLNNAYQNTTYLEVLTARSNALSSEINMIDSKFKQLNAIVELYKALGGGWNKE